MTTTTTTTTDTMTPDEALARLVEGNRRYLEGGARAAGDLSGARAATAGGQRPFAAVLGCADSRVPPEIVFDQGIGDLFVVRVAGNVAGPTQVGSIEFAVEQFGTPLVVVLGHANCGAVAATLAALRDGGAGEPAEISEDLRSVVSLVAPAVSDAIDLPADAAVAAGVTANVRAGVTRLAEGSRVLADKISAGTLRVVGAEYALDTGKVQLGVQAAVP